ncbi:MAG: hypothetical protein E6344_14975 [Clostridium sp.]|nr:hypothetical protein [Clostridium sp.]
MESLLKNEYGRLRDVYEGKDGSIYIATSNRDGRGNPNLSDDKILRLVLQYGTFNLFGSNFTFILPNKYF